MEPLFKYSLFGYDPSSVHHTIEVMKKEYEEKIEKLNDELSLTNGETGVLKERICRLVEEISHYESINQEINDILYFAHMRATEKVYNSTKNAEQMAIEIREAVLEREKEFEKLKETLKRLTDEMRSIMRSNNLVLEASQNE